MYFLHELEEHIKQFFRERYPDQSIQSAYGAMELHKHLCRMEALLFTERYLKQEEALKASLGFSEADFIRILSEGRSPGQEGYETYLKALAINPICTNMRQLVADIYPWMVDNPRYEDWGWRALCWSKGGHSWENKPDSVDGWCFSLCLYPDNLSYYFEYGQTLFLIWPEGSEHRSPYAEYTYEHQLEEVFGRADWWLQGTVSDDTFAMEGSPFEVRQVFLDLGLREVK